MSSLAPMFEDLVRRWRLRRAQIVLLEGLAVAFAIAAGALLAPGAVQQRAWLAVAVVVAVTAMLVAFARGRARVDDGRRLALYLDRQLPSLQESGELLLGGAESGLGSLQRGRALRALTAVEAGGAAAARDLLPRWPWARAAAVFAGSLSVTLALAAAAASLQQRGGQESEQIRAEAPPTVSAPAPRSIAVTVTPPGYTGRPPRTSALLDVDAEESASVRWQIAAQAAAQGVLVFDEGELPLERGEDGHLVAELTAAASRVYSLVLRVPGAPEYRSPTARLAVLPDRPPSLSIAQPPQLTVLAPEAVGRLRVEVAASDDYGLGALQLVATLAHGAGEQVEFRVERLSLAPAGGGNRFARTLDLQALGMVAGSELYLQAEARDRRAPRPNLASSEVARVRVEGGSGESVGLDSGLPQVRVEASLRSQRQIIADTERLLGERPRLSADEFLARSEALGFDQRALRLRYGGLLGEEFESGVPEDEAEHAGDETPGASASAAMSALPEGMVHRHDSEEVATYFDDPERARMKAALAEMWGSEGKLRLGDPRAALPFEYRALRLLKSAQEQARVYVAKLGSELPKLDPAKRLSGELEGIGDRRVTVAPAPSASSPAGAALAVIAALRASAVDSGATTSRPQALDRARAALAAARSLLAEAAAASGGPALAALDALAAASGQLERGQVPAADDLAKLERGLAAILPAPLPAPLPPVRGGALDQSYRRALTAAGDSS